ncbi:putative fimbrial anchor [Yersinia rohdei]|uniref:TadE/TadG family type IV pilus assembly protein n=1 Tax=Yersinia rohdei TaxID=29485 RepID=UPI00061C9A98|nr:pilus assembly protein [Yersinia rohdei]CNE58199.1 putative fimbrial anchor [Yersinia rohdei]
MKKNNTELKQGNSFQFFIKNENGTILMSFVFFLPIFIGLIFLSFEISCFIQKKAKLSDAMEQATLALTVENNNIPSSEQEVKNNILISSFAHAYLPEETFSEPVITINSSASHMDYHADITMSYPAKFLNKAFNLISISDIKLDESAIAKKNTSITAIPTDVVFVTDYSGSMNRDFNGTDIDSTDISKVRIVALRRIFKNLHNEIQQNENINLVGFVPFTWGTKRAIDNNNTTPTLLCHFPFVPKKHSPDGNYLRKYNISGLKELPGMDKIVSLNMINDINYGKLSDKEYISISEEITDKANYTDREKALRYLSRIYYVKLENVISPVIEENIDYEKTIKSINGSDHTIDIPLSDVRVNDFCLRTSMAHTFDSNNMDDSQFSKILNSRANGGTLISSGILSGNNLFKETNNNNRKIMVILSDGDDNDNTHAGDNRINKDAPYLNITKKLIDNGICERIKDNDIRMVFIAIGYTPDENIDWKKCVGEGNFYLASNAQELELDIKRALATEDTEVGRNTPKN